MFLPLLLLSLSLSLSLSLLDVETYGDVVLEHPGYDASAYDDTPGDTYDALPDTEALAADAYADSPAGTPKQLPTV